MVGCLNGAGYVAGETTRASAMTTAALAKQAAAVLAFTLNASLQVENYTNQKKVASASLDMAEEQKNYLQNVYEPREIELGDEYATIPALSKDVEAVDVYTRRYVGRSRIPVIASADTAIEKVRLARPRYATSAFSSALADAHIVKIQGITTATTSATIKGYQEYQARNDANWNRYLQALGVIRNLQGSPASLMRNAMYTLGRNSRDTQLNLSDAANSFFGEETQRGMISNMIDGIKDKTKDFKDIEIDRNAKVEGIMGNSNLPKGMNTGYYETQEAMTKKPQPSSNLNKNVAPNQINHNNLNPGNQQPATGTPTPG